MEITANEIQAILEKGTSPEGIKTQLKHLFSGSKFYSFSYCENWKPNDNCPGSMSVRGVVSIFNEKNLEDEVNYYGPWRCQ